jgi:hypothetical protein
MNPVDSESRNQALSKIVDRLDDELDAEVQKRPQA